MKKIFALLCLMIVLTMPLVSAEGIIEKKLDRAQQVISNVRNRVENAKAHYMEKKALLSDIRESLGKCRGNPSEECNATRVQLKEDSREFLMSSAQTMEAVLEATKEKIENSEWDEKDTAIAEIEGILSDISDVKEKIEMIDEESTKQEIKDIARELNGIWRDSRFILKKRAGQTVNFRIGRVIEQSFTLVEKLEEKVEEFSEAGEDMTEVSALVEQLKTEVELAQTYYDEAKAKYVEATTVEEVNAVRRILRNAHNSLKDARQTLREILIGFREV